MRPRQEQRRSDWLLYGAFAVVALIVVAASRLIRNSSPEDKETLATETPVHVSPETPPVSVEIADRGTGAEGLKAKGIKLEALPARPAAWIELKNGNTLGPNMVARDDKGKVWPIVFSGNGSSMFLIVPHGYRQRPKSISLYAGVPEKRIAELPSLPEPIPARLPKTNGAWPGLQISRVSRRGIDSPSPFLWIRGSLGHGHLLTAQLIGSSSTDREPAGALYTVQLAGAKPRIAQFPAYYPEEVKQLFLRVVEMEPVTSMDLIDFPPLTTKERFGTVYPSGFSTKRSTSSQATYQLTASGMIPSRKPSRSLPRSVSLSVQGAVNVRNVRVLSAGELDGAPLVLTWTASELGHQSGLLTAQLAHAGEHGSWSQPIRLQVELIRYRPVRSATVAFDLASPAAYCPADTEYAPVFTPPDRSSVARLP